MPARFIVADVMDGLASLETGSVDVVITSPPFLALRSYLPADHELKGKEIGSEATPAEFIDTLLKVTAELRRVLAPHGSICVELGDTYAGSSGSGGWKEGQEGYRQYGRVEGRVYDERHDNAGIWNLNGKTQGGGDGWPLAKSRTLIPSLYQIALAYGFNPLTGTQSPAGQWRIRNIVTWARPNPPVGALGDKWRPATSDLVIACTSGKRYWDDLATRKPYKPNHGTIGRLEGGQKAADKDGNWGTFPARQEHPSGAPLLDYWVIPPGGYAGAHYAVFPEELVVPCVQAMCPQKVCLTCGEPSRRITGNVTYGPSQSWAARNDGRGKPPSTLHMREGEQVDPVRQWKAQGDSSVQRQEDTLGWSDCGHDTWRPGLILDPFAGSGTTLAVATGHGHDAIGIDLDERNADLARDRVGPFFFEKVDLPVPTP